MIFIRLFIGSFVCFSITDKFIYFIIFHMNSAFFNFNLNVYKFTTLNLLHNFLYFLAFFIMYYLKVLGFCFAHNPKEMF